MSTVTLWFDNFIEALAAHKAAVFGAKSAFHAAGCQQVLTRDGDVIKFKVRTNTDKTACKCGCGCH